MSNEVINNSIEDVEATESNNNQTEVVEIVESTPDSKVMRKITHEEVKDTLVKVGEIVVAGVTIVGGVIKVLTQINDHKNEKEAKKTEHEINMAKKKEELAKQQRKTNRAVRLSNSRKK